MTHIGSDWHGSRVPRIVPAPKVIKGVPSFRRNLNTPSSRALQAHEMSRAQERSLLLELITRNV